MGNTHSSKIPVNISLREYQNIQMNIPYNQLQLIKVLQTGYPYEVTGTIYVDDHYVFKGFEVRTDNNELFSSCASDWKISYHTHPDNTAIKYGLRYFSPPSVDDIMVIFDHDRSYTPETISGSMGEISIIFTNEGIYVLQADRERFVNSAYMSISDEEMTVLLHTEYNQFMADYVRKRIIELTGNAQNLENPDISHANFVHIIQGVSNAIAERLPLQMKFYDWIQLKKDGLPLFVNTYFLNKKVID